MPYLNIDLEYFDHPKTLMLEAELGGHRAMLIPVLLWRHAGKYHSDDGYLKGYTPAAIAKVVQYDHRNAEKLVEALIKCRFLDKKKDGFQVHDWSEHNGHLALFRERARIAAEARWNKSKNADKPAQENKSAKPAAASKKPLFTDHQIHSLRSALAQSMKHRLISQANETAWQELLQKLEKATRNKKIENIYAYAMKAAMTAGNPQK